jgi:CheY-like chemotaxis protein
MPAMQSPVSRPPHLLVASHYAAVRLELQRAAERHGYSVLPAATATEALEMARSGRPDLVILDEALPEIDILDFSRALRADPLVGPSTPILLVTAGRPTTAEHHAALRAGVWEFLRHPFDPEDVATKLRTYLLLKLNSDRARGAEPMTDETGLYTARGLALRARELTLQAFHHSAPLACVALAALVPGGRDATASANFVAWVLKGSGRRSDAIGRPSPALFAIVAPGTDGAAAVQLANRLARRVRAASPAAPPLRAGYAAVANARAALIDSNLLLARASSALEVAKASNRESDWIRPFAN